MKEIQLTQGKVALIDDEDYLLVSALKWSAHRDGNRWYAHHCAWVDGKKKTVSMHRLILAAPQGSLVDHRDGDGLNNRKSNIRLCTESQNLFNKARYANSQFGFKGVSKNSGCARWVARITVHNKTIHLGGFVSVEMAARAYDAAAIQYHGEFARLNFPESIPA